jgi:hypothetical protein
MQPTLRIHAEFYKTREAREQSRGELPRLEISGHVAHLTTTAATIGKERDPEAHIPKTTPTETEAHTTATTATDQETPTLRLIAIDHIRGQDRVKGYPSTAVIIQKRLSWDPINKFNWIPSARIPPTTIGLITRK